MTHDVTLCLMSKEENELFSDEEIRLSQSVARSKRLYNEMTHEALENLAEIESLIEKIRNRPESITASAMHEGDDYALKTIENLREIRDTADEAIRQTAENLLSIRYPQAEIAEAAGVTRQTISRWKKSASN